jgi:hypothetical protein
MAARLGVCLSLLPADRSLFDEFTPRRAGATTMSIHARDPICRFGASAAALLTILIADFAGTGESQQVGRAKEVSIRKSGSLAQDSPSRLHPLEIDTAEPLRLVSVAHRTDPGMPRKSADNSSCLVCHANFREEELASAHESHGVGCASCHGPSTAHRNDEANIIPPDIMVPAEKLDASCTRCHGSHDVEPRAVVARFLERCASHVDLKSLVCTTCHGEHRLSVRTVRWDRKTGKLVSGGK